VTDYVFSRFDIPQASDEQMDSRAQRHGIVLAQYRAVK